MMKALYSGVSGLQANQQKMDVVGNNIANVNTVAYQASRVVFSDLLYQTISSSTAPNDTTGSGGSNAKQIGLGVKIGAVDVLTTKGGTESTGNATDLSIAGDGYFIVKNGAAGSYLFTRAGDFSIDENGNLVTGDGLNVCGWTDYTVNDDGTYQFDTDQTVSPINIYADDTNGNKKIIAAQATKNAIFAGSLDSSEEAAGTAAADIGTATPAAQYTTTMTVYDSLGNSHELKVAFTKCYVDTTDPSNPDTTWYWTVAGDSGTTLAGNSGYLKFDSNGKIVTDDPGYSTTPTLTITPAATSGANSLAVKIDFANLSTTAAASSAQTTNVDGYAAGTLESIAIDANGVIMGVYTNGQQQPLGMVALAQFANPSGLQRVGNNYYTATANSGTFTNGVAAKGAITSGTLEMSNVDLSNEFSQMITTQRAYQASSKLVTVADEMLETIIDMKR
jgi:flagellar hook protein FlgE